MQDLSSARAEALQQSSASCVDTKPGVGVEVRTQACLMKIEVALGVDPISYPFFLQLQDLCRVRSDGC